MSISTQPETVLDGLVGHDLVTVITIDRETPWRPHSPLDVPRNPRQAGGMPVRRMPLAEMIEHNEQAMRTGGRFWWVCPEMLDQAAGQLGHGRRDAAGEAHSPSTDAESVDAAESRRAARDAETSGPGRSRAPEAFAAESGDGRGDRGDRQPMELRLRRRRFTQRRRHPAGVRDISEDAFRLLDLVTNELGAIVFDQAEQLATARAGTAACIEAADIHKAAEIIADVGTRRRIRWQSIDSQTEGGA